MIRNELEKGEEKRERKRLGTGRVGNEDGGAVNERET